MSNSSTSAPVSQILKNASTFEDEPRKKSREDWRKAKELEEARKAGTAPAAVDEEGKDINPHIPQYISSTPWYYGASGPTLKHQRPQPEKQKEFSDIDKWYIRGQSTKKATKWREGACENCGAMGHKRKDCFERPRARLARFTNEKIAPDEVQQPTLSLSYDGKRDRWAGYDPSEHRAIVEEYQKIEEAKKQLKAEKLNSSEAEEEQDEDEDDEDKYVDDIDMPGTKVDSKQRITVRNLRIREDTAKYLRNLDPNSAYYDPKTRSMRDNPYKGTDKEADYAGENSIRFTGDTKEHAKAQLFSWEAQEKGINVHLLAEPTRIELMKQDIEKNKEQIKSVVRDSIIDKYGGAEHLDAPPRALLLAQTEEYIEYSRTGQIIKGQEKKIIRSRYEEDIYINNHTTVFGSYWRNGQWGYKCCHSLIKNSYCCGEAGQRAIKEAEQFSGNATQSEYKEAKIEEVKNTNKEKTKDSSDNSSESSEEDTRTTTEKKSKKEKRKNKKRKHKEKKKNKKKEEDKLKEALRKEDEHNKNIEKLLQMDERKRPYNSMYSAKEPTEEEKEAYQMKRFREEDPMAQFM
ncbi:pre-mRNA-splicing factor Slu7 [Phymastichus coffea]|uniref:pre-mRNA-splicing factor Slu7 n=1 Tax=Phymastichus coffea TaxID=108790 RepID=UPI00273BDC4C|nr:pre-mRNA-splicing factor Slu7 [Phymastichus coffea]